MSYSQHQVILILWTPVGLSFFTFVTSKLRAKCCRGLGLWWEFCANLSLASFWFYPVLFVLISFLFNPNCLKSLEQVCVKCQWQLQQTHMDELPVDNLMGMAETTHLPWVSALLFLLSHPATSSWFCLLRIPHICPFLFTSGSPSIDSCLDSCGDFKPVCLVLVTSSHTPTWERAPAHRTYQPPWPIQGSLWSEPSHLVGFLCCSASAWSNSCPQSTPSHPGLFSYVGAICCSSSTVCPLSQCLAETSGPLPWLPSGTIATQLPLALGCVLWSHFYSALLLLPSLPRGLVRWPYEGPWRMNEWMMNEWEIVGNLPYISEFWTCFRNVYVLAFYFYFTLNVKSEGKSTSEDLEIVELKSQLWNF